MEFVFLLLTALCFFFFFSITNYHFCGILASSHQLYNLLNEYNHSEEKMASFVEVVLKCCSTVFCLFYPIVKSLQCSVDAVGTQFGRTIHVRNSAPTLRLGWSLGTNLRKVASENRKCLRLRK